SMLGRCDVKVAVTVEKSLDPVAFGICPTKRTGAGTSTGFGLPVPGPLPGGGLLLPPSLPPPPSQPARARKEIISNHRERRAHAGMFLLQSWTRPTCAGKAGQGLAKTKKAPCGAFFIFLLQDQYR